jgi:hypothetical protein
VGVCTYQYFTQTAKTIFDSLWDLYGYGDDFWYTPPYTGAAPTNEGVISYGVISIIGSVIFVAIMNKRRKET